MERRRHPGGHGHRLRGLLRHHPRPGHAVFDLDPHGLSFLTYILVMAPLLALGSWLLARGAGQGRRELGLVAGPPGKLLVWGSVGGL